MDDEEAGTLLDPHHARESGKMVLRAIANGWITAKRWPTDITEKKLKQLIKQRGGGPTAKEKALLVAFALMNSRDDRPKGIGMRSVEVMESQNQKDDQHDIDNPNATPVTPTSQIGTQINVQLNGDPAEQQRIEVLGIIDTLRERAGARTTQKTAGGRKKRPTANGGRKAGKS